MPLQPYYNSINNFHRVIRHLNDSFHSIHQNFLNNQYYNRASESHDNSKVNIENALKHSKEYFKLLLSNNSWTLLGKEDDIVVYKALKHVNSLDDEYKK